MAGLRNELKITVDQTGALQGAGGPVDALPWAVSRRAQTEVSPFQAVTNFSANRQLQFTREIAMEMARDREAARAIESSRWKSQVRYEALEIASAVRASEERLRRRQNLTTLTRAAAFDDPLDDGSVGGRIQRRSIVAAKTSMKRIFRGWGTGAIAGLGTSAAFAAADGEGAGAVGRVLLSTVGGGAWGGAPGAVGAFITSSISEIIRALNDGNKEIEDLRKSLLDIRKEISSLIDDVEKRLREAEAEAKDHLEQELGSIAHRSLHRYRENRWQQSGLVN